MLGIQKLPADIEPPLRRLNLQIEDGITDIAESLRTARLDDLSRRTIQWLSAPDLSSNHNAACDRHHQDTGLWILEKPDFLEWKRQRASSMWLHGKAGCGKTILSSTIIHNLLKESSTNAIILYFDFDFQVREKQSFDKCLRSLLVQVLNRVPAASEIIKRFYIVHDNGNTSPSLSSLMDCFRQTVNEAGSVYLVLDALDECSNRLELLKGLKNICKYIHLHSIVTSRKELDIEDTLDDLVTWQIPLEESVVDSDVRVFVRAQMQSDNNLLKWPDDIRNEIETTLLKGANGMYDPTTFPPFTCFLLTHTRFRWGVCQLDAIGECRKISHLRDTLKSLPKTLDETYDRILRNIPEQYIQDVSRILQCLMCSFYPLAIEEVADIIPVNPEVEPYYDPENRLREPRDLLSICSGLVSVVPSKRWAPAAPDFEMSIEQLRLSHYSVREYLVSNRRGLEAPQHFLLDDATSHITLANLCICYLLRCDYEPFDEVEPRVLDEDLLMEVLPTEVLAEDPFGPYAAMFWSRHLRAACPANNSVLHAKIAPLISQPAFISKIVKLQQSWFSYEDGERLRFYGRRNDRDPFRDYPLDDNITSLYLTSLLGLDSHVSQMLTGGEAIDDCGPEGSALSVAASFGHLSILQILLRNGASVNAIGFQQIDPESKERVCTRTALQSAIEDDHEDIVNILLSEGADVNTARCTSTMWIPWAESNTPLQAAVAKGNMSLIRELLSRGADVNALGTVEGNALYLAVRQDSPLDLLQTLLESGANPNIPSGLIGLPLLKAIKLHDEFAQTLLLKFGADLGEVDSDMISRLLSLSLWESDKMWYAVQRLARLGMDMNIGNPLKYAVQYGYSDIVEFLLDWGVDVNSQEPQGWGDEGTTALHLAACRTADETSTLEILLQAKADVNLPGGPYGSALEGATWAGNARTVEVLIANGAVKFYGGALAIARRKLRDKDDGLLKFEHGIESADFQAVINVLLANGATEDENEGKEGAIEYESEEEEITTEDESEEEEEAS